MQRKHFNIREDNIPLNFPLYIAKAFQTVSPGTKYYHNWHIDLIADKLKKN